MEVSNPKMEGKLHHEQSSIKPQNITIISYHFISALLNANFYYEVSVANDFAIDFAKCVLLGKVMSGSVHFNQWKWVLHIEIN